MDFDDTPQEMAFRKLARSWLDANAPHYLQKRLESIGMRALVANMPDLFSASKEWQKTKASAGWSCPHWPKEYGGRGATPIERAIWDQEEGVFSALSGVFGIGLGMCAPTLMAYATEEQKRWHLPRMASGEKVWCQLFSEPSAGSDLAGLRTRAERRGDQWTVNGQKIWTSGAHQADYGLLLARSDPSVPKHSGLTMFFIDMHGPGVEVRPIKQANGDAHFNEVYFTDLSIPDSQRLGDAGRGWTVSLTTLMNERLSVGRGIPTGFPELLRYCCSATIGEERAIDDPAVRSQLARWAARDSGLRYTVLRTMSALSRGETPGPENSITKLVAGSMLQDISSFALDLQGAFGLLMDPEELAKEGRFQSQFLRSPATRIEGGSDEILRNIIAERVLGLPGDIRIDKSVPFNSLPTSARSAKD